jgi:hypothetical protein
VNPSIEPCQYTASAAKYNALTAASLNRPPQRGYALSGRSTGIPVIRKMTSDVSSDIQHKTAADRESAGFQG